MVGINAPFHVLIWVADDYPTDSKTPASAMLYSKAIYFTLKINQWTEIKHVYRFTVSLEPTQSTVKKYFKQVRGKNRYQSNYNIKHTKASRHPMLPESQDRKVILPEKTKRKSQKVAICKTRMSITFKELHARMCVTTKCYTGQMLEVCLKTTEAKTLKHQGWEEIPRELAGWMQSGPKEGGTRSY